MRIFLFAKRNIKEILRDPVNFFFSLGFPLALLILLSIINNSIPAEAKNTMFKIKNLAPGLAMFGSAFMALFAGMLLSKDRTSSFLMRLFTSPMTAPDFILGYTLPMMVMTIAQATITFLVAGTFELDINIVTGWLSGVFIPVDLIGGPLKMITNILPFYHSVQTIRESLTGNFSNIFAHLAIVAGYTVIIFALAVIIFNRKMNGEKDS